MNRELTGREKTLLLVLVILVLTLGYFKLIYEPINDQIDACRVNTEQEQTEMDSLLVRLEHKRSMECSLETLRAEGEAKPIPAYDNSGRLMMDLNVILTRAKEYSLDFSAGTTSEDYVILRPLSLTYTTNTYEQSREILDLLCESENVNRISDLSIQRNTDKGKGTSEVRTSMVITYFEVAP